MFKFVRIVGLLLALVALPFGAQARESVPIVDHVDIPVMTGSGKTVTAEQVREAILTAANAQKWDVVKSPTQDLLSATLHVRGKHTVVVAIPYSVEKFSIKYQSSVNMNYAVADHAPSNSSEWMKGNTPAKGTPLIHPFYNRWVQDLLQGVQRTLKTQ